MSDEAVIALAAVIMSGVIGLATLGFNFWNSSSERKQRESERREVNREWYRRTLFDRRLEALQEGKRWLNQLSDAMYNPFLADDSKVRIGEALDWYGKKLVYIHGEMPDKSPFGRFLYETEFVMQEGGDWPSDKRWQEANNFLQQQTNELLEGISRD